MAEIFIPEGEKENEQEGSRGVLVVNSELQDSNVVVVSYWEKRPRRIDTVSRILNAN